MNDSNQREGAVQFERLNPMTGEVASVAPAMQIPEVRASRSEPHSIGE
jgi:hypothetical protein